MAQLIEPLDTKDWSLQRLLAEWHNEAHKVRTFGDEAWQRHHYLTNELMERAHRIAVLDAVYWDKEYDTMGARP